MIYIYTRIYYIYIRNYFINTLTKKLSVNLEFYCIIIVMYNCIIILIEIQPFIKE